MAPDGDRVRSWDSWNLLVDLMNKNASAQKVYVDVTYTYTDSSKKSVKPVWLDIDNCGDSEYPIPAGPSDTHPDWKASLEGRSCLPNERALTPFPECR